MTANLDIGFPGPDDPGFASTVARVGSHLGRNRSPLRHRSRNRLGHAENDIGIGTFSNLNATMRFSLSGKDVP